MRVTVRVVPVPVAGPGPPDGAPVTIEIRDVSQADGPSVTVATAETVVGALDPALGAPGTDVPAAAAVAELEVDDALWRDRRDLTVWARIAVSGQPRVTAGDWVTTQSCPLRAGVDAVEVEVRPV